MQPSMFAMIRRARTLLSLGGRFVSAIARTQRSIECIQNAGNVIDELSAGQGCRCTHLRVAVYGNTPARQNLFALLFQMLRDERKFRVRGESHGALVRMACL